MAAARRALSVSARSSSPEPTRLPNAAAALKVAQALPEVVLRRVSISESTAAVR